MEEKEIRTEFINLFERFDNTACMYDVLADYEEYENAKQDLIMFFDRMIAKLMSLEAQVEESREQVEEERDLAEDRILESQELEDFENWTGGVEY